MTHPATWRVGLLLASGTALLWATLPIALKIALEQVDVWTLTWFRFACAGAVTLAWLAWRGGFSAYRTLGRYRYTLLLLAGLGLIGNYVGYLFGLRDTTPANAQLLIQLAPLLLALGGFLLLREPVNRSQWFGFALILGGLSLFFVEQQARSVNTRYGYGVVAIVLAAITWAGYGLAQKRLFDRLSAQQVLLAIYLLATVLLWPTATPTSLARIDGHHWWAIGYCAFNTVAAYGCFAEAQARWDSARVGAVLAVTPILTIGVTWLCSHWLPDSIRPEQIGWLGAFGAALIIGGSMLASLSQARRKPVVLEAS